MHVQNQTSPTASGFRFGKYEVVSRLGIGGMAEIFKCRLRGIGGFDKLVVVKRILDDIARESDFVTMFLEEARLSARLNHPNIVSVFEIDQVGAVPYLAMEYVDGPTLAMLSKRAGELDSRKVLVMARIISDVCVGLQYAHHAKDDAAQPLNLIHRDISPHNIILSKAGMAKLLDFGVAKWEGRSIRTTAGVVKGKIAYMPPEQVMNRPLSQRGDIYSLGLTLYVALTGRRPFSGDETTVLKCIVEGEIAAPSTLNHNIPPLFDQIIQKATQKKPEDRYQSARAMHEALDAAIAASGGLPEDAVADFIGEVFPDGLDSLESVPFMSSLEGQFTPSSVRDRLGSGSVAVDLELTKTTTTEAAARKRKATRGGAAAVTVLLLAVLGWFFLSRGGEERVAAEVLDRVARLTASKQWEAARAELNRAEQLEVDDAALLGLVATARRDATLGEGLEKADAALQQGDAAAARRQGDLLAALAPGDARVRELLHRLEAPPPPVPAPAVVPRPPEQAAAPLSTASLKVSSSPRGTLYVDGVLVGKTPAMVPKVLVGSHEVEVHAQGYQPYSAAVEVRADKANEVRVTLTRARKGVAVRAPPPPPVAEAPPEPVQEPLQAAPEPAKEPEPVKAVEPAAAMGVAASAPAPLTPAVQVAAAAPKADYKPRLPREHQLRSVKELVRAFQIVESEVINGGGPAAAVKDSTYELARMLGTEITPAEPARVYPQGMYYFILKQARAGRSSNEIGAALRAAHENGSLTQLVQ